MDTKLALTITLELVWGAVVAIILQYSEFGQWLDKHLTWLPALVGTGVAGIIGVIYFGWGIVGMCALFLTAAFIPLFCRAIANLYQEWRQMWRDIAKLSFPPSNDDA